jgi:hypothetical protein
MSERHVTVDMIVEAVCASTGLARRDILSDRRADELAIARCTVFWLAGQLTELSLAAIGRIIGDRDHSTVFSGRRRANELRAADPDYRAATDALLHTLVALQRLGLLRIAEAADPFATACRVLASPEREAVRVGVGEIIALCRFVADHCATAPSTSPDTENSDAA